MTIRTQSQIFPLAQAPTKACHASTIAAFEGKLYAAWFGGSKESHPDVNIWLSVNDGSGWSSPVSMAGRGTACWNPVLFPHGNRLFLYYKEGKHVPSWYTLYRVLEGGSWSEAAALVPGDIGGRGPVKNKPIRLHSGLICAPASLEHKPKPRNAQAWQAFVELSADGVHWEAQEIIAAPAGLIQPTLWESPGGLHALLRSDAGAVFRSDSADGGHSWCQAYATALPNNNSGIDAVATGGALYLVYNPVAEDWGPRTPLVLSKSLDNGRTWCETLTLEDAPGEYSYPAVIAAGGSLHLTYTHNRKGIVHAEIAL